jgi:hypothetical protein
MKERINWIDWAKALAVMTVVFCHLPQSQEWFYYRFLQACVITIFFFLSGYLKKDRGSNKENWKKYWQGLIIPYIIYNAIVYPYWLLKYYIQNDAMPDVFRAMKPILGALFFQHENAFCEPLNGPLWYLPAILIMHVMIDLSKRTRFLHPIMITLCIISFFLYAGNKYYEFLPNLTPMGIFRRLPYYYIGYVMGQQASFARINRIHAFFACILCLTVSLLCFEWHIHEERLLVHVALFYPVNIGFLFAVLSFSKLLNGYKSRAIINLSIGTLVIIGLHIILISIFNIVWVHLISPGISLCYHWYEALPVSIAITAILYPIILLGKNHIPCLLGRSKNN